MLVANLTCTGSHRFEGWFRSDTELNRQLDAHAVSCPLCHSTDIRRLPSAPALLSGRKAPAKASATDGNAAPTAEAMRRFRDYVRGAEDVGERFAEEARRIHYGESPQRHIRGASSLAQTRELLEEGIAVLPLPSWLEDH